MGVVLDSSILIACERGRFDLERLLGEHSPPAVATVTATELWIGVERANTAQRRAHREAFVQNVLARVAVVPFDMVQARLFAVQFAEMAQRGEVIGDRDLQIAVTALSLDYELATLNIREFQRVIGLRLIDVAGYILNP